MTAFFRHIAVCLVSALTVACGNRDSFTISCETDPSIQRMVTFTYADASGIKTSTIPLEKGKARLTAKLPTYTLVSVTLADGTPIADCIMHNGDKATVRFTIDPEGSGNVTDVSVKGNKNTDNLRQFELDNDSLIQLGFSDALNRSVGDYISAHRNDPVSTVLLLRYFDSRDREAGTDSLLLMLNPDSRPMSLLQNLGAITAPQLSAEPRGTIYTFSLFTARDSIKTIRPSAHRQTILAFLASGNQHYGEQIEELKELWELRDSLRLGIVEYSLTGDSARWRTEISRDSVGWIQAWAPGGAAGAPIRKFNIPRQPFYILFDSAGRQLYRGSDIGKVRQEAFDNLKPRKHSSK